MARLGRLGARSRRSRVVLVPLAAAVILAGAGLALGSPAAMSRAGAASAITPLPCDGSTGSSIYLYGSSTRILSQTTIPVCASGGVTVSFHSTAQGCSAGGPCGYTGTETWRPTGGGQLTLVRGRQNGRDTTEATLILGAGDSVLETVTGTSAAGRQSACQDRGGQFAGFLSPQVRGARLIVDLGGGPSALLGPGEPPLLGTQCAGPFDGDVGAALPAASFAVAQVRSGHLRLDLSGGHPFVSRDFAGEVSSDLELNLGRAHTGRPSGGAQGRGQRLRNLFETYRIQRLRGQISASVTGSSDPARCARLAACGTRGTIHVAARLASRAQLFISATGPARRPVVDFLTALGRRQDGDPSGLTVGGGGGPSMRGAVTARMRMPARCHDTAAVSTVALQLEGRRGRMQVALSAAGAPSDPLRTRCPGPALGSRPLAAGSVPLAAFGHRTITVTLRGARFAVGPYRVSAAGRFSVTLRRTGQSTQIFRLGA
jgi:hypothetical protein